MKTNLKLKTDKIPGYKKFSIYFGGIEVGMEERKLVNEVINTKYSLR